MKRVYILLLFAFLLVGCESSTSSYITARKSYSTKPSYPINPDLLDAIHKLNPEYTAIQINPKKPIVTAIGGTWVTAILKGVQVPGPAPNCE